jgi:8-oxo-dGTP pyrophosphatase MutT (NUDIX family)
MAKVGASPVTVRRERDDDSADVVSRPDLLQSVGIGAVTLWRGTPTASNSEVRIVSTSDAPYRGGRHRDEIEARAEQMWAGAIAAGRHFYNRPPMDAPGLLRLNDWTDDGRALLLNCSPTWFYHVLATNGYSMQPRKMGEDPPIDSADRHHPDRLEDSVLANPLSVNVVIVGPGPLMLVQLRGANSAWRGERWQCSAAGFVDAHERTESGALDAAIRETSEETGIVLRREQFRFLSLVRSYTGWGPGLTAYVALNEVPNLSGYQPTVDASEIAGYEWWEFDPLGVFKRVAAAGGWRCVVPLGAAAIVTALADSFGEEEVIRAAVQTGLAATA